MRGGHGDDRRRFSTFLDNILTVGESASSEELAGRPQTHLEGLIDGAGVGAKNCAADFAKEFRQ